MVSLGANFLDEFFAQVSKKLALREKDSANRDLQVNQLAFSLAGLFLSSVTSHRVVTSDKIYYVWKSDSAVAVELAFRRASFRVCARCLFIGKNMAI